jgi:hypothetical protein
MTKKTNKEQAMIYTTLPNKLKIKQHEPHYKSGFNSCSSDVLEVPVSLVALVKVMSLLVFLM